jgi:hypothetical protein
MKTSSYFLTEIMETTARGRGYEVNDSLRGYVTDALYADYPISDEEMIDRMRNGFIRFEKMSSESIGQSV